MAKLAIKRGTTSKIVRVFIQDSSKTDGSGLTGLVYNSSGLSAYYATEGTTGSTAVTLATATVGTYASGGFVAVDGTNLPGVYELGIPNAALASGNAVIVMLKGATNMVPVLVEIELDAYDPQAATNLGLTDLDAAVSTRLATSGYIAPPSAASVAAVILATPANLLVTDASGRVTVGTNADKTGYALTTGEHTSIATDAQAGLTAQGYTATRAGYLDTLNGLVAAIWANTTRTVTSLAGNAADLAAGVWDALTSAHTTANTFGEQVGATLDTNVGSRLAAGSYTTPPTTAAIAGALLVTAANKLATNASGQVQLDLTEAVPTSNTAQTVGDALNAARAQGFGKWTISGTTLTLYAGDGTTVVRTFTLDSSTAPTQRT